VKSVEFSEEQLNDLDSLGQMLFGDENDPTSVNYKRKLVRPKINWLIIILYLLIPVAVSVICFFVFDSVAVWICVLFNVLYLIFTAKRAAICAVKVYQRYAPESVRMKCRFEPSCSEYMILSIEKYGVVKGIIKGINRLSRCKVGNGGFDYP